MCMRLPGPFSNGVSHSLNNTSVRVISHLNLIRSLRLYNTLLIRSLPVKYI
jgi:hypothetical protein